MMNELDLGSEPRYERNVNLTQAGAFTDFHIDLGGFLNYFHVLKGIKIFYFVEPTDTNLACFEDYFKNNRSEGCLNCFGNSVEIRKVTLTAGRTSFMPAGWIHAVYTAEDTSSLPNYVVLMQLWKRYTLSSHSQYFKAMFLGSYREANMPEVPLNGVDPFDMQKFSEFLYHQPSITDDTVEGLLLLADQYDTGILKEKCEDFLIKDSKKSLKKRFKMFLKYLTEKIIDEMRTAKDVKEVIDGEDVSEMDQKLLAKLLVKSVSFAR